MKLFWVRILGIGVVFCWVARAANAEQPVGLLYDELLKPLRQLEIILYTPETVEAVSGAVKHWKLPSMERFVMFRQQVVFLNGKLTNAQLAFSSRRVRMEFLKNVVVLAPAGRPQDDLRSRHDDAFMASAAAELAVEPAVKQFCAKQQTDRSKTYDRFGVTGNVSEVRFFTNAIFDYLRDHHTTRKGLVEAVRQLESGCDRF